MPNVTTFVPSGTPSTFTPSASGAGTFAMPAVDGSNLDCTIVNNGVAPVWFGLGARAPTQGSGDIMIPAGQTVLFTASAATLAAAAADPLVVAIGTQLSGASTLQAIAGMAGGSITVTRGTATSRATF